MPKIRKIASIERGLEEVVQSLTEEEIKQAINKGASYVRKCSDPQPDNDGIKRNIDHVDSVKLDIKCIEKGISPPLLTAHQFIIDQAKSEQKTNLGEVNEMLVKFSILEGELNKVVIQATDPASPGGKKIDDLEKKKVFEAIKNIEDKILKIKLAIDKSK
jgi:hypothetical protein|tara:strand:- start:646 stop:1125 length:480 start_codon:yes stop_codon:yes gene_type:complete